MSNGYTKQVKTLRKWLVLFFLQVGLFSSSFGQTAVPAGAPGAAFNDYMPLGSFWGYERAQMQYTGNEINVSGLGIPGTYLITAVEFYLSAKSTVVASLPIKIYMKQTPGATTGLTSTTYSNALSGYQLVYSGNLLSGSLVTGSWVSITLQNPFLYTAVAGSGNNIEVITETNFGGTGGEASNGKNWSRSSTTPTNCFQSWVQDNTPPTGNGILSVNRPDIRFTFNAATPCSAAPAGPITVVASASSVCSGSTFSLSTTGIWSSPPYYYGYYFQWQYATSAGGPWTDYAPATQNLAGINPTQTAANFWRVLVSCGPPGSQTTSSTVFVDIQLCYCTSGATSTFDTDIGQVRFGTLINPATLGGWQNNPTSTGTYSDFTSLTWPCYTQGLTYNVRIDQVTSGTSFWAAWDNVFIDWNHDGVFDPNAERAFTAGPTGTQPGSLSTTTPAVTFTSGTIKIPFTSAIGSTRMRVLKRELFSSGSSTSPPCGTFGYGETEDYTICIVAGAVCNLGVVGATAGTASVSAASVCSADQFVLSLTGTNLEGSGISYQWQSSTTSAVAGFTNIPGANYYPYTVNGLTPYQTTWYRCVVTCPAGGTLNSNAVRVDPKPVNLCMCVPVYSGITCSTGPTMTNITIVGATSTLNNTTTCGNTNGTCYVVYPPAVGTTCDLTAGGSYIANLTSTTGNGDFSMWIDFNGDGDFFNGAVPDPGEWVDLGRNQPPGLHIATFNVPVTAVPGLAVMRLRSRAAFSGNGPLDPCTTFFSGEGEDYLITINPVPATPCVNPLSAASFPINAAPSGQVCAGTQINFSLPNLATNYTNLTYQWYVSTVSNASGFNIVAGATNKTYSMVVTQNTWVQCVISCTNAPGSTCTTTYNAGISVIPVTWLGITSDWNDAQNWCGRIPTLADSVQVNKTVGLVLTGRPSNTYKNPVVSARDTMYSNNIFIANTDSVTVLTDIGANVKIASNVNNDGKIAVLTNVADTVTFGSGLVLGGVFNAIFKGAKTDNLYQIIYTASELRAAGMQSGDYIDSLLFRFSSVASTSYYKNFTISYKLISQNAGVDQYLVNEPITGLTTIYGPDSLYVPNPAVYGAHGKWTPLSGSGGWLRLPTCYLGGPNNFVWTADTFNIILQVCFSDVNNPRHIAGGAGDVMFSTATTGRKSVIFLTAATTNLDNTCDGCSMNTSTTGLDPNFGLSPGINRPDITFRFRRPQQRIQASIGGNLNNQTAGSKIWNSMITMALAGNLNNTGTAYLNDSTIYNVTGSINNVAGANLYVNDTATVNLSGSLVNAGTTTFSSNGITKTSTFLAAVGAIPVSDVYGLSVGMTVSGTGIASGTTITNIYGSGGSTVNIGLSQVTTGPGTGVTLTFNNISKRPTVNMSGPAWTNNGTIVPGKSYVSFISNSDQTIGGTNASPFYDLNIQKTSDQDSVKLANDISVSDSLVFRMGQLRMNHRSINISNSQPWALSKAAGVTLSGANVPTTGTFTTGLHTVTYSTTSPNGVLPGDIIIAPGIPTNPPTYVFNTYLTGTTYGMTLSAPYTGVTGAQSVTFKRTNGILLSEDSVARVNWNIGTTNGGRLIPFGHDLITTPKLIPMMYYMANGNDMGTVSFSTYRAIGNSPMPPTVTNYGSASVTAPPAKTTTGFAIGATTIPLNTIASLFLGDFLTNAGVFQPGTYIVGFASPNVIINLPTIGALPNGAAVTVTRYAPQTNDALYMADRFWLLAKTGAGATPATTFGFNAAFDERPCPASGPTYWSCMSQGAGNRPSAQPWWYNSGTVKWGWAPSTTFTYLSQVPPINNVDYTNTSVLISLYNWSLGNSNPWALTTGQQPLPIELLKFSAQQAGSAVKLDWQTASEESNDFFTVQRTIDFEKVIDIAKVKSHGDSKSLQSYECFDKAPVLGKVNYYRLLQTDLDGTTTIASEFVPVRFGLDSRFDIMYVRNEGSTDVIFDYDSDEPVEYVVTDLSGKVMISGINPDVVDGVNMIRLDNTLLSQGMYLIQLRNSHKTVTHKFAFTY